MKRSVWLAIVVLFLGLEAYSQQVPLYSLYNSNRFLYNPALTGEKGDLHAHLVYRRQWSDIPGAPETRAITLDGAISKKKIGLGAYVYQDFTDILERTGAQLTYAYHLKLGGDHTLSAGLGLGIQEVRIDFGRVDANDPTDQVLTNNLKRALTFEGNAGIHYSWKGLSVGFSIPQFVESELRQLNDDTKNQFTLARHYLFHAAYDIAVIKDKFFIEPGAFFRMTAGGQYQVDGNVQFRYKELAWLAVTYRYDYAVTIGGGFQIHDRVSLGYAYDLPINDLQGQAGGTHEVIVGIKFGKKEDEGIIEELKKRMDNVEQNQNKQQQQIDSIGEITGKVIEENEELQGELDQKDQEIEELKADLEKAVKEFAESLTADEVEKLGLPDDIVFEGERSDLEFITGEPDSKYFLVVAAHRTEANARAGAATYKEDGHKVGVVLNKRRSWYYIFLEKPGNLADGLKELYELRKQNQFKDSWIHIYQ